MAHVKSTTINDRYSGPIPTVFKSINVSDINIYPFIANKTWIFYSGSSTSSISSLQGIYTDIINLPAIGSELTFNDASNANGSLQSITYFSINHLFYKNKTEPFKTFGPTNKNCVKQLFESASIFSIPQLKIGDGIVPKSFLIETPTSGTYAGDKYGNIYDTLYDTASIISQVKFYVGFNEFFDVSRYSYVMSGIQCSPGIVTTTGQQKPIGKSAFFTGSSYLETEIDGLYTRDTNYAISFYISSSNQGTSNQLILAKAKSISQQTYPFKIELNSNKKIEFSAGRVQIQSTTAVSSSWNHVVCQKSGSVLQLYVNNVLESSVTNSMLTNLLGPIGDSIRIDNNDKLKIGGYSTNSLNLNGYLDEIRIFNTELDTSQISALNDRSEGGTALQTAVVGNVFAKQGLAVVSSVDYRLDNLIYMPYTASYQSTKKIYELNVIVKLKSDEFNCSSNISVTGDDDLSYLSFTTGSAFAPYITTIGLYNEIGQLLAVGKLANPIRKRNDVNMNFLIRLDLDSAVVNNVVRGSNS